MAFTKPVMAAPMPTPSASVKASTKNDERVIFIRASCFQVESALRPFSTPPYAARCLACQGVRSDAVPVVVGRCSLLVLSAGVGVHPTQKHGAWTHLAVSATFQLVGINRGFTTVRFAG